jgi:hypothetical protein
VLNLRVREIGLWMRDNCNGNALSCGYSGCGSRFGALGRVKFGQSFFVLLFCTYFSTDIVSKSKI